MIDSLTSISQQHKALAKVLKAMAQPVRIALLAELSRGEQCVCHLAAAVGAERSNVSRHLSVLENAGVVSSRKQAQQVFYSIRMPCLLNVFECVGGAIGSELGLGSATCRTRK